MLALTLCVLLAPAPFLKPLAPPAVRPGVYRTMLWHGETCGPCYLAPDGGYRLLWRGEWWEGRWKCKEGVLFVEEWPSKHDSRARITWAVKLSSPTEGKELDFWPWKIVPRKEPVY